MEAVFLKANSDCLIRRVFVTTVSYRLHNAVQMKQKDKQNISQLEKKLKAEQEARSFVEKQLMEEKKRKKLEEATAARAVAFAAASRYVHVTRVFVMVGFPCPKIEVGI